MLIVFYHFVKGQLLARQLFQLLIWHQIFRAWWAIMLQPVMLDLKGKIKLNQKSSILQQNNYLGHTAFLSVQDSDPFLGASYTNKGNRDYCITATLSKVSFLSMHFCEKEALKLYSMCFEKFYCARPGSLRQCSSNWGMFSSLWTGTKLLWPTKFPCHAYLSSDFLTNVTLL